MATRSANVNVRVEPDIKEQAEAILEKLGVSTSAFINMTYRQVILHKESRSRSLFQRCPKPAMP